MKFTVRDVDLYYGKNQALKKVNMDIEENEVTALIGPSGCGKSTFLKILNRLHDLNPIVHIDGEIKLEDKNILTEMDPIEVRRRVGMVFQQPNPFVKTIYNNVAYGLKIAGLKNKGEMDDRVKKALVDAALWDEVKDRLHTSAVDLSGGQQQRLCIARTLAPGPEVILMDEPTSALDPISTAKIEDLCQSLKEHYTIVIVTHNMQQALRVSDKTAFFLLGEVIEMNETQELFQNPKEAETSKYITGRFG